MTADTPDRDKPPLPAAVVSDSAPPRASTSGSNPPESNGLTPGAVIDAVVALMRAANPGIEPDTALATRVAGGVHPMLVSELAKGRAATGQELLSGPGFATVVTQYLGSPNSGYLDDAMRKALLAQLQRANDSSGASVALAAALGIPVPLQASQRGNGSASAGSSDSGKRFDALSIASIQTDAEYRNAPATAELVQAGVSFQTFRTLLADGFAPGQMVSAVRFTKGLGLDVNQSAVHVAYIQRARPEDANSAMRDTSANWKRVAGFEKNLAEAHARGAGQEEINQLEKQLREEREYAQKYVKGYTDKLETSRPGSGQHYKNLDQEIQGMQLRGIDLKKTGESQIGQELDKYQGLKAAERQVRHDYVQADNGRGIAQRQDENRKQRETTIAAAEKAPNKSTGAPATRVVKLDLN